MVLFPEHEEFSTSAVREGCAEVRDVFVARPRRRLGVATTLMETLEDAVRERGPCTSDSGTCTRTGRSSPAPICFTTTARSPSVR
jgi:GNAT superfamily N-acetyltransferase